MRILIFGGTGEARDLANQLVNLGHDVTSSLAGRTPNPLLPKGIIRIAGFGGVTNLAAYFDQNAFNWVIDATHPFAAKMSTQLVEATRLSNVNFVRVTRPEWSPPAGTLWAEVADINAALTALPDGAKPFLTVGHKDIGAINAWPEGQCVIRLIKVPSIDLPKKITLILDRPPYDIAGETELLRANTITHLITKNSGGGQTRAKIDAAANLGLPIYAIRRPPLPRAREVFSVEDAISLVQAPTSADF